MVSSRPRAPRVAAGGVPRHAGPWALRVWVVVLSAVVLGPVLAPGFVLTYDMVWVPHLAIDRADFWGLGSSVPRAVPSDAVVAALGVLVPQQVVQKAVLLGALVGAGLGGAALTRRLGAAAQWAGATFMVWNPFVAERLGIGHWPLLVAYAAVPWLVLAVRDARFPGATGLLALTALTPASGVMGVLVAIVVGRPRDVWRWALLGVAVNAPWWVAALLSPAGLGSDPAGVGVFAASGAGPTPTWLELLALGGVWNAEVTPAFRTTVVATVLTALFALVLAGGVAIAARRGTVDGRLTVLAVAGLGVAMAAVVAPDAVAAVVAEVPGAGLIRDGSRWVMLAAPAVVLALAQAVAALANRSATAATGWIVALMLPIALVPDLGWGLAGQLRPVEYPGEWRAVAASLADEAEPGDLLSLPFTAFRRPAWNDDRTVLDPAGRYFERTTVTSDALEVDGVRVDGEDPRAARIGRAVERRDWRAVAEEGVGWVVVDTTAPGADEAVRQLAGLPAVVGDGTLRLYRVPDPVVGRPGTGRVVGVVVGWSVAGLALVGAAAIQIGSRRKTPRGR